MTIFFRNFLGLYMASILGMLMVQSAALADDFARPQLLVYPHASIKTDRILLGDIGRVSFEQPEFADVAAKLSSIDLGQAPAPMATTNLLGGNILAAIEQAGIPTETIGYSIPKTVSVERAGREISKEEIIDALRAKFSHDDLLDIQVKDVIWTNNQVVPAGDTTTYDIYRLGQPAGGKIPLRIEVFVDSQSAARFLATAVADDWREIPVLARSIDRGMLVRPDDVQMVRLNLYKQPDDVVFKIEQLVGRRAKSRLSAGDVVRSSEVDIPPLIKKGSRVTMVYSKGGLSASAAGVAQEDGFEGSLLQVKNSKSQRLLKAKVKNSDQVEVIVE